MKSFLVCVVLVAVFASMQAAPTDPAAYNADEMVKKVASTLDELSKKIHEHSGLHTTFDKEKFLKYSKEFIEKVTEVQNKLKEHYETNFKDLPGTEDMKKKFDELNKQCTDIIKSLNSPEVQKSHEKWRETMVSAFKKIQESTVEVGKSMGVSPSPPIHKLINEMVEDVLKVSKTLQEKMSKVMEEAQKELKIKPKPSK